MIIAKIPFYYLQLFFAFFLIFVVSNIHANEKLKNLNKHDCLKYLDSLDHTAFSKSNNLTESDCINYLNSLNNIKDINAKNENSRVEKNIIISDPWIRATANSGSNVSAGFFKLVNIGKEVDRLLRVECFGINNTDIQIHYTKIVNGIMKMRPMVEALKISPGEKIEFKPGGYHIMFLNLSKPLKAGTIIRGKLFFEKAGEVYIEYKVVNR